MLTKEVWKEEILVFTQDINFLYMKQKISLVAEKQGDADVVKWLSSRNGKKNPAEQSGITEAEDDHPSPKEGTKMYLTLMCILFPAGKDPKLVTKEKKNLLYRPIGEGSSLGSVTF